MNADQILEAMKKGELLEMTITGLRLDGRLLTWEERQGLYPMLIAKKISLPVNRYGYGQGKVLVEI